MQVRNMVDNCSRFGFLDLGIRYLVWKKYELLAIGNKLDATYEV